jgi:hypothetical protein
VYSGIIVFSFGDFKKEIPFILELESKSALFDVSLKITSDDKKISLNKRADFEIEAFNFGDSGRVDVFLNYELKDLLGNVYNVRTESVAVETRASLSRSFFIPENIPIGTYVISAELTYGDQVAVASDSFEVIKSEISDKEKLYIVIILLLFVIICIVVYFHLRHSRLRDKIEKMKIKEVLKK